MDKSLLEKLKKVAETPTREELTPGQVKLINSHEHDKASMDLFKKVANYILISDQLRCEINNEQDLNILIDKSLRCIALMTGDSVFYDFNIVKIKHPKEV